MRSETRTAVVVNFGALKLEPHVDEALQRAWESTGGHPLSARDLLEAAIAVGRGKRSQAFAKLAEILPVSPPPAVKRAAVAPLAKAAIPFERPLAQSFFVAESFLAAERRVWGRDFVTLALLSQDDPSLDDLVSSTGRTLADVRGDWMEYVRSSGRHRTAEIWEQWYRAAGVPAQGGTVAADAPAAAYLMTWNPSLYPPDRMAKYVEQRDADGTVDLGWSTGNRLSMEIGSRVFLMRQGVEPRGLVGAGITLAEVEQQPHWRPEQRAEGKKSNIVQVRWEALDTEPFLDRSSLVALTGEEALWSTGAGGVEIDATVLEKLEGVWHGAWARRAHGLAEPMAPELEPTRHIARFDTDRGRPHDPDSLNIDRYVNAFARVMASQALEPPLSIGLFGDWGSGKTFFMERLEDRINGLAEGAESQSPPLYWSRICQIRFNAWHYAETDLWASLVSTIFNGLRAYLDGEEDDADEFNRLLNELELATELRRESEERLAQARKALEKARTELLKAESELSEVPEPEPLSDDELRAVLGQTLAAVSPIGAGDVEPLLRKAADLSGNEHLSAVADRVEQGKATVEDTRALLMESRGLFTRAGFWWRVLSTAKLHRSPWFWLVAVLAVALPVGVLFLEQLVGSAVGWTAVLGDALLVGGSVVGWCRARLAEAAPVFDRLDLLQSEVERRIAEAEHADRKAFEVRVAEAKKKKEKAVESVDGARSALERAKTAEEKASIAVRESTSQARLGRFIRERAESADYEKYLGLIAMIHRDFDRLCSLMTEVRSGGTDPDLPRLDRIVLYVDDLDRCYPPDKVVRVLEAVHLLLFFPLFVVVVGVDSRWVSRALNRYYEGMLADEAAKDEGAAGLRRAPADSQDFLEKIFQVPFWLRRMDPLAVKRMIHRLITDEEVEAAPEAVIDVTATTDDDGSMGLVLEAREDETDTSAPGRPQVVAEVERVTQEAEAAEATIGEDLAELPTEALRIGEAELRFMDAVAPLMPRTPRSVKRFVNIYRLYKAALSTPALGSFMGTAERPGNFRAVQVLLALVTGTPDFAKVVVDALERTDGSEPSDLASLVESNAFATVPEESWRTTLEALRTFATGDNNLTLDELREVSPLVCRYSVHHMVSERPGTSVLG